MIKHTDINRLKVKFIDEQHPLQAVARRTLIRRLTAGRLPRCRIELQLMLDLDIKVEYEKQLGRDLSIAQLKGESTAIFLNIGLPT